MRLVLLFPVVVAMRITEQEEKRLQLSLSASEARVSIMQGLLDKSAEQLGVAYRTIQLMREHSAVSVMVRKEVCSLRPYCVFAV